MVDDKSEFVTIRIKIATKVQLEQVQLDIFRNTNKKASVSKMIEMAMMALAAEQSKSHTKDQILARKLLWWATHPTDQLQKKIADAIIEAATKDSD